MLNQVSFGNQQQQKPSSTRQQQLSFSKKVAVFEDVNLRGTPDAPIAPEDLDGIGKDLKLLLDQTKKKELDSLFP
ncbi:hypothetical protein TNCT_408271 [Trichonephila clavata]|uniref:Uncharacterized protein n=1 Tax=Trichonephila clavata TaxID=2740835 RepID=A0A8X6G3G2_TRICU|nr:hypothetical protein TNCT_408271 [Trichonephila clavata]